MGSDSFTVVVVAKSAEEAFKEAIKDARKNHGRNGCTGTIAEKESFIEIPLPKRGKKDLQARALLEADRLILNDERIEDEEGPAGCIQYKKNEYLFFGWAQS